MSESGNYGKTKLACYLGFVTQAITANFAPLLFLTFFRSYGISYAQLALIPLVFFLTQLIVDFLSTRFVDQVGYRKCMNPEIWMVVQGKNIHFHPIAKIGGRMN